MMEYPFHDFLESFVGTKGLRTAKTIELLTKKEQLNDELRKFLMPYENRADNMSVLMEACGQLELSSLRRRLRENMEHDTLEMTFQAVAGIFWDSLNLFFNNQFDHDPGVVFVTYNPRACIDPGFMYTYVEEADVYVGEDYSLYDIIGWEALRYNEDGEIDSYENSTDRIVQRGEFKTLDWRNDPRISTLIPKNGKTYLVMAVDDEYLLQRVDPVTGWDIGEDE